MRDLLMVLESIPTWVQYVWTFSLLLCIGLCYKGKDFAGLIGMFAITLIAVLGIFVIDQQVKIGNLTTEFLGTRFNAEVLVILFGYVPLMASVIGVISPYGQMRFNHDRTKYVEDTANALINRARR